MLTEGTLTGFIDSLASKSPTPGGGGAAGVAASLAAACGSMVSNLLDGKARVAEHQQDIERISVRLSELQQEFLNLVEADATAFTPVSEALALPRDTPEQIAVRVERLQAGLEEACKPPLTCMQLSLECLDILGELIEYSHRLVISDVGVGAELCRAALRASSLNVFVKSGMMSDARMAYQLNELAQDMVSAGDARADAMYDKVKGVLR